MQRYCKVSAMQNESWKTLNYRMFIMTKSYSKLQFICLIGGSCPNLGTTRPRVGICKSRLEALTCKYMNIGSMLIREGSGLLISSKTLTFEVMDTIVWVKFFL
jgi:hypothetical protein